MPECTHHYDRPAVQAVTFRDLEPPGPTAHGRLQVRFLCEECRDALRAAWLALPLKGSWALEEGVEARMPEGVTLPDGRVLTIAGSWFDHLRTIGGLIGGPEGGPPLLTFEGARWLIDQLADKADELAQRQ